MVVGVVVVGLDLKNWAGFVVWMVLLGIQELEMYCPKVTDTPLPFRLYAGNQSY